MDLDFVALLAGGGGVGGVILAIAALLRSSFSGITEQWATIFATQEKQIDELRRDLRETREQAALDRGRYDTEIASAKLAEKQCREDWIVLSVEVRELRKAVETKVTPVVVVSAAEEERNDG